MKTLLLYSINMITKIELNSKSIKLLNMPAKSRCSASEYVNGDDLPTCSEHNDETWEEFFVSTGSDQAPLEQGQPDDATFDLELEPPTLTLALRK